MGFVFLNMWILVVRFVVGVGYLFFVKIFLMLLVLVIVSVRGFFVASSSVHVLVLLRSGFGVF